MAHTRIIFLRHADTQKDPNIHASEWGLSETGLKEAEGVRDMAVMSEVDVIYVSEEPKTELTIRPLAQLLRKVPIHLAEFNEVARGEKFLSKEEFELEKRRQLEDLSYAAFNGESGNEALARFKSGVSKVLSDNPEGTVLIATHGTVLNLYFADILKVTVNLPERWEKTGFCAYGIVEDGVVTKDIVI